MLPGQLPTAWLPLSLQPPCCSLREALLALGGEEGTERSSWWEEKKNVMRTKQT